MGEPGTKELLSLEDLEAAGNLRTGRKHVLSILTAEGPAFVDVRVTKEENTFPMIAPGAAARDMVG